MRLIKVTSLVNPTWHTLPGATKSRAFDEYARTSWLNPNHIASIDPYTDGRLGCVITMRAGNVIPCANEAGDVARCIEDGEPYKTQPVCYLISEKERPL